MSYFRTSKDSTWLTYKTVDMYMGYFYNNNKYSKCMDNFYNNMLTATVHDLNISHTKMAVHDSPSQQQ